MKVESSKQEERQLAERELQVFISTKAMEIPKGMKLIAVDEKPQKEVEFEIQNFIAMADKQNVYSEDGDLIAFIYNEKYYVAGKTDNAISILKRNQFVSKNFYIKLLSYLPAEKQKQQRVFQLLEDAAKAHEDEFRWYCKKWAMTKSVYPISSEALKNCFKIPRKGIRVRQPDGNAYYAPIVSYMNRDEVGVLDCIGQYAVLGKITFFVHADSDTYVAKGNHIINVLKANGYKPELVLTYQEEFKILDEEYQKIWEMIPEINDSSIEITN